MDSDDPTHDGAGGIAVAQPGDGPPDRLLEVGQVSRGALEGEGNRVLRRDFIAVAQRGDFESDRGQGVERLAVANPLMDNAIGHMGKDQAEKLGRAGSLSPEPPGVSDGHGGGDRAGDRLGVRVGDDRRPRGLLDDSPGGRRRRRPRAARPASPTRSRTNLDPKTGSGWPSPNRLPRETGAGAGASPARSRETPRSARRSSGPGDPGRSARRSGATRRSTKPSGYRRFTPRADQARSEPG